MKQKQFESQHEALWAEINILLTTKNKIAAQDIDFPAKYRRLCQHLALALQRGYSPALTDYLQKMVGDCHQTLYGTMIERPMTLYRMLLQDFPQKVREEWRLLLVVNLAFWGVALLCALIIFNNPEMVYSFLSPARLEKMHAMYQPGGFSTGRGAQGDFGMFAHYVMNNVSIDFRTFGAGIFGGIPSLFVMASNGVELGVVATWLHMDPVTRSTFWPFVATHASFEIIGMLLAGVAGMRLGMSLINPGRLSRRHALVAASRRMFPVIVGASIMTFIAAFFEAFWCANPAIASYVKFISAAITWSGLICFFIFAGRRGN